MESLSKNFKELLSLTPLDFVKDDIEYGYQNVLPLWAFGLNY